MVPFLGFYILELKISEDLSKTSKSKPRYIFWSNSYLDAYRIPTNYLTTQFNRISTTSLSIIQLLLHEPYVIGS